MSARILLLIMICVASEAVAADPSVTLARAKDGEWIAYRVALPDPKGAPCCFDFDKGRLRRRGCRLTSESMNYGVSSDDPPPASDEALQVFLRKRGARFDRVLAVRTSCPVDIGRESVTTINDVSNADSIALLERGTRDGRSEHDGLSALAHHAGSAATAALIRLSAPGMRKSLRHDAYFWLADARGVEGYEAVRAAFAREPSGELRKHLVFCLSESDVAEAARELVRIAREHDDEDVRGEALFWLAQKKPRDAEAIIGAAIDRDPSAEVRKKAVFALSELPSERAIILLRKLVESDQPRAIRREALFWLAQIEDDAVLSVFDELLAPK